MRTYGLETQQPKAQPAAVKPAPAGSEKAAEENLVDPVNKPAAKKQPKKSK
jgi:hypothetical protein